eukprot:scaffold5878_cov39-Isochrysis_galbana.AAC.1
MPPHRSFAQRNPHPAPYDTRTHGHTGVPCFGISLCTRTPPRCRFLLPRNHSSLSADGGRVLRRPRPRPTQPPPFPTPSDY